MVAIVPLTLLGASMLMVPGLDSGKAQGPAAVAQRDSTEVSEILATEYTNLKSLDDGPLEVLNQFLRLGEVRVARLLPDTSECVSYFALHDATYCYQGWMDSFRVRRLDAFSVQGAGEADRLATIVLGDRYAPIRGLLFFRQLVSGEGLECASFFVRQFLRRPEEIQWSDFYNYDDPPIGLNQTGLACLIHGRPVVALNAEPPIFPHDYEVWDLFESQGKTYLIVLRTGYEYVALQLHAVEPPHLRLLNTIDMSW